MSGFSQNNEGGTAGVGALVPFRRGKWDAGLFLCPFAEKCPLSEKIGTEKGEENDEDHIEGWRSKGI